MELGTSVDQIESDFDSTKNSEMLLSQEVERILSQDTAHLIAKTSALIEKHPNKNKQDKGDFWSPKTNKPISIQQICHIGQAHLKVLSPFIES